MSTNNSANLILFCQNIQWNRNFRFLDLSFPTLCIHILIPATAPYNTLFALVYSTQGIKPIRGIKFRSVHGIWALVQSMHIHRISNLSSSTNLKLQEIRLLHPCWSHFFPCHHCYVAWWHVLSRADCGVVKCCIWEIIANFHLGYVQHSRHLFWTI